MDNLQRGEAMQGSSLVAMGARQPVLVATQGSNHPQEVTLGPGPSSNSSSLTQAQGPQEDTQDSNSPGLVAIQVSSPGVILVSSQRPGVIHPLVHQVNN